MSLPLRLHREDCRCRKCLTARANREEIEEKIYILAQLGKTGAITAEELTGKKVKTVGAA